ncbi:unnamed protein product [Caenorhabditis auriculariae]|uniref:Uncharacterized protein n=1 Tax=Caenorhabditis auriculariae TaxID=2777116 RepID=A0A8S1GW92_9PELO|nr:unnamed protein product [Caenorhabditis auriculariae]
MEEEIQQLRTNASGELMTDEDFIKTIEEMGAEAQEKEINDLLKAMHENRIVSWDEAERILQETDRTPIKSSLPEQTRPSEPDNDTDVDNCIRKLLDNDPSLKEVNLNNMKRTPVPAIRRLLEALAYNEHCERLSLANMGLYDHDIIVLVTVIEMNQTLKKVNLETNYLSGEFFSKLFKATLSNETLEEIKAVNQGVSFSTQSEKEIIDAIMKNKGLTKISINFRLPEGRFKVENATLRNGELRRIKRREAALKAKMEAEELAKNPVPHLAKESPPKKQPPVPAKEPPRILPDKKPVPAKAEEKTPPPQLLIIPRASRESEEDTDLVAPPAAEEKHLRPTWQPRRSSVVVDQGYAPVLDVSSKVPSAEVTPRPQPEPKPRNRGPPLTAKNMWEQRIAKQEKKLEKQEQRPLLSIQKIREMEKAEETKKADMLDVKLKKEPKKLVLPEKKKVEESEVLPKKEPKKLVIPERKKVDESDVLQKKEPKKLTLPERFGATSTSEEPAETLDTVSRPEDEPRTTTVIKRTVMRRRPDSERDEGEESQRTVVKKVVKKRKPRPEVPADGNILGAHQTQNPPIPAI